MSDVPTGPLPGDGDAPDPNAVELPDTEPEDPPQDGEDEFVAEGDEAPLEELDEEPQQRQQQQQRRSRPGEATRWRERAAKLEAELAEARGYQRALQERPAAPPADPYAELRAYQQRWSEMAPADAIVEALQYGAQQNQRAMMQAQIATNDRIDKQAYDAEARTSRIHQRYAPEVERMLQSERQRGNYVVTRADILFRLAGMEAVQRASQAAPGQRRAAAARVAGQQTRPGGARSDAGTGGRRPAPGSAQADVELIQDAINRGLNIFDL